MRLLAPGPLFRSIMEDHLTALRAEFDGEPGSFLFGLRADRHWDPAAFERLTRTMLALVGGRDPEMPIPRWIAEGFWYLDWYVREWTARQPPPEPAAGYYGRACERLTELAYWLFVGESPHQPGLGFQPLSAG